MGKQSVSHAIALLSRRSEELHQLEALALHLEEQTPQAACGTGAHADWYPAEPAQTHVASHIPAALSLCGLQFTSGNRAMGKTARRPCGLTWFNPCKN